MSIIRIVLLVLSSTSALMGQRTTQAIRGQVFDKDTRIPLIGATIELLESSPSIGTVTDESGRFTIEEIPIGRYDIAISYLGYSTHIENAVLVSAADDVILEIGLTEASAAIGEVIVFSDSRTVANEAAVVSARSFSLEELNRIPGGLDDPARMARKFPGISPQANALSNELNVRGNSSRTVRWRLDEIDIYNPSHFALLAGNGGSVTIFSQRLLTNTDFYSGAFPADYGNALGGVFDVRFRNGNTQKRQHSIQLSLLGLDLATEGPMNKQGTNSYIANYRLSSTFLIDQFIDLGGLPTFQDLSFKLHFKMPKNGVINIFGLGGISSTSDNGVLDTARQINTPTYLNRNLTGTLGISYLQPHSDRTYSKHTLVGTGLNAKQNTFFFNDNQGVITNDTTRINAYDDWQFSYAGYVNHKFNPHHTHRSGLMLHGLLTDVSSRVAGKLIDSILPTDNLLGDTLFLGNDVSLLVQAYTRSQFSWGKWNLNLGLHFMYLLYNNDFSVEPRLGLRYKIHPRHTLNLGYGLHSQMEPFFALVSKQYDGAQQQFVQKNRNLKFNKAHHLVLGYQTEPIDKLRLGVELYYQYHYDMTVRTDFPISRVGGYDFRFEGADLNNGGTGHTYGIELVAEKAFSRGYYILFNSSFFEANYTANDGVSRPSQFNANYIVNLVGGKEFVLGKKKASFLSINLSATYSGSQYYTPVDLEASREVGFFKADYNNPNGAEQDPLLIIDFSLVYKLNGKKTNSQFSLQVGNILNRSHVVRQVFNRATGLEEPRFGSGIIPMLSWRISF